MEDDLNFKVNGRQPQFTSPTFSELGTAQPLLVLCYPGLLKKGKDTFHFIFGNN